MRLYAGLFCLVSFSAQAMESLDDASLSGISGADGLTVTLDSPAGISANQLQWITDDAGLNNGSCSGGIEDQHACTLINDLSLAGEGGPLSIEQQWDVGSDLSGNPYLGLYSSWGSAATPVKLTLGAMTFNTANWNATANSLGQLAVLSNGSLSLENRGGLFNQGGNFASFQLQSEGDLIYRQGGAGSPELSLANMVFDYGFTNGAAGGHNPSTGTVGISSDGLRFASPYANMNLGFDVAYKGNPSDFDRGSRSHLIHMGWHGGLVNPEVVIGGGGFSYGSYSSGANSYQDYDGSVTGTRSQGLNLLFQTDLDSDFALIVGEGGGNRTHASFTRWRKLGPGSGPMLNFPLIFDVAQGGSGPQGLCVGAATAGILMNCAAAGGEWIDSDPPGDGDAAFAVLLRDAHLRAYPTQVQVVDPLAGGVVTPLDWGVAFTYGKLDADIFIRPEGPGGSATGLQADISLVAQSPDAWRRANSADPAVRKTAGAGWERNTHVMIMDSSTNQGIGFVNGDIIWTARDLYLRVTDGDSAYPGLPGGLWLQSDSRMNYRFRGIFGGGDMSDLSYTALTKLSLADINLSTDQFIFVLNPLAVGANGDAPIGFNGLLNFDGNAFMRFGEISSPQSQFFIDQVQGSIAWREGSVSLVSGQNTTSGNPEVAVKNHIDLGQSAGANFGGAAGNPLIGRVGFGTEDFGRLAFPEGVWHSEIRLAIPQ